MTISLCMIVKNEREVLARALAGAAAYADEIIVADTGSTDGTRELARSLGCRVYDFEWRDDFSAARNYAFSKASCEYRMWLDADDIVPPQSARAIASLKRRKKAHADIYMLPYVTEVGDNGRPRFSYYRERIVKSVSKLVFGGRVHEAIALNGRVERVNIPVLHAKPAGRSAGTRNLDIYRNMRCAGERFTPRDRYYYARELYYNGEYGEAAREFEAFIADPDGFYVNKADACVMLSRCRKKAGDRQGAYLALYDSFLYGAPTGEAACEIALMYFADGNYRLAIYWFELAAHAKPDIGSGAFVDADCYAFLPYIWLSVCYDKLGNADKAFYYHCKARKLKPEHPSVVANGLYFKGLGYNT